MAFEMSKKNHQYHDEVERAYDNQPNEPILPVDPSTMLLDTIKYGSINRLLFKNNKSGPDETWPKQGIIYSQNVQGLSGKDKRLEYLVDPIVDLMVAKGVRGRFIGGVAIILSLAAVTAWRSAGEKPPITNSLQSKFVGRFLGFKLQFPRFDWIDRRLRG